MKQRRKRTRATAVALALILWSTPVLAGSIHGRIEQPDGSFGSGIEVVYRIGDTSYEGRTDESGRYRIVPRETGRGELFVRFEDQRSTPMTVRSFDSPSRNDLELRWVDGELRLKRR